MNEALVSAISRMQWEFFVTPTYASRSENGSYLSVPPSLIRERMLFAYIRQVEKAFNMPDGTLIYVAREELGEKNKRPHWHLLLAGLHYVVGRGMRPSPNNKADIHRLWRLWSNHCGKSAGICDVRAYDAGLSAVDYIMKGLEFGSYSIDAANRYEVEKFNEDEEGRKLIVAPSLGRYLITRSSNRRHLKARSLKVGKRDRSTRGIRNYTPPDKLAHRYDDPTTRLTV